MQESQRTVGNWDSALKGLTHKLTHSEYQVRGSNLENVWSYKEMHWLDLGWILKRQGLELSLEIQVLAGTIIFTLPLSNCLALVSTISDIHHLLASAAPPGRHLSVDLPNPTCPPVVVPLQSGLLPCYTRWVTLAWTAVHTPPQAVPTPRNQPYPPAHPKLLHLGLVILAAMDNYLDRK